MTTKKAKALSPRIKAQQKLLSKDIVLWKQPLTTLNFFFREAFYLLQRAYIWFRTNYLYSLVFIILLTVLAVVSKIDGFHQQYIEIAQKYLFWCAYWVGLGILSSVGFGTGLHTFILYLGPHIAAVTLAAHECGSLNFPEPPYPDEIICPEGEAMKHLSLWDIIMKVRLESFMWGAGTALGELPPYFMARAARLSGQTIEEEFEYDSNGSKSPKKKIVSGTKHTIKTLVEKVGFFGILACASIPNPLFDLAGITCGHFLIPFWTFFGATLIGKAVIKMLIQKTFVIIAFSEHHVEKFVEIIKSIPYVGHHLNEPFREFLIKQKQSLHRHPGDQLSKEPSWLAWIFEKFVLSMIIYFIVSIINSMAQNCHQRMQESVSKSNKRRKKK